MSNTANEAAEDGISIELDTTNRSRFLWEAVAAGVLMVAALIGLFYYLRRDSSPVAVSPPASGESAVPAPPAPANADAAGIPEKPGWRLTFHDEFDGAALDSAHWIDSYPGGERTHANNEQQYYAAGGPKVAGGFLHFTATRQPQGGLPYTSGMVSSYGKFAQKFGWFEIRTRVPKGQGMWPAFWLLPDSRRWPPEIDILEILGSKPREVEMSNHWGTDYRDHKWQTGKWSGPDFTKDFHTFAVEWKADAIIWYVDGTERYRTRENIPKEPMYILSNLAVGGDLPGMPDATTPFPGVMDVDYIRVYERAP